MGNRYGLISLYRWLKFLKSKQVGRQAGLPLLSGKIARIQGGRRSREDPRSWVST